MNLRSTLLATAISAAALVAFPAGASGPMPAARHDGAVTYVSGGVGLAEISAMTRAAARYPLELVFVRDAASREEYLAGVDVRIEDARGRVVLDTVTEGPFLLADLPAGRYKVSAAHDDNVKNRNIEVVSGKHRRVVFVWPS